MATEGITVPRQRVVELQLRRQGLLGGRLPKHPASAALRVLQQLGQVQVDPMNVAARSCDLVLWSRAPHYRSGALDELRWPKPRVFEYWTRHAALLPMSMYPLIAPAMGRERARPWWPSWVFRWLKHHRDVADRVLKEVEVRGPLTSRDFPNEPKIRGGWGATKATREALECLWAIGTLMVRERRGGEKVFDLTERVLPRDVRVESIDEHERVRRLLRAHLQSIGACEISRLAGAYGPTGSPPDALLSAKHILEMADDGWLSLLQVEGVERRYVCLAEDLPRLRRGRPTPEPRMTALSPFDSLLWDRRGVAELWDFDYRLEAYTPAKKRQYGYYVILHSDGNKWQLVQDLIDMGADSINPCEPLATMEVKRFREAYPDTVIGSMVDCQDLLAFGTPEEIRSKTIQAIEDSGGARTLIGSTSEIHPEIKVENALAMYEVARNYWL